MPTNMLCGAYWNIEDRVLLTFEPELREHSEARHHLISRLLVLFVPAVRSWAENPDHSWDYPVPHPTLSGQRAYQEVENKWGDDAYGDAHRRLCLHLARELSRAQAQRSWFRW